jgi:pimeloyl-ACP methyl ester carboxylesterase
LGITACRRAVPDVQIIAAYLSGALAELAHLAAAQAASTPALAAPYRLHRDYDELLAYCRAHVARASNPRGFPRQLVAVAASGPRTELLAQIAAPTLVIHGDDDPPLPIAGGRHVARLLIGEFLVQG